MAKLAQFVSGLSVAYPGQKEWLLIWKKILSIFCVTARLSSCLEAIMLFLGKRTFFFFQKYRHECWRSAVLM